MERDGTGQVSETGEHVVVDAADRGDGDRAGRQVGGEVAHVVGGDEVEATEALVEVGELAEGDLGPAEPRHPGVGVLERQGGAAGELADGAAELVGGHTAGRRAGAARSSISSATCVAFAGAQPA